MDHALNRSSLSWCIHSGICTASLFCESYSEENPVPAPVAVPAVDCVSVKVPDGGEAEAEAEAVAGRVWREEGSADGNGDMERESYEEY